MTKCDAQRWIAERFGDVAVGRIARFLAMVIEENGRQNLIAPSTVADIWTRHALDSAQLAGFGASGHWLDVGTGGGFPGMVVALLREDPVTLVEPRRRRADFLQRSADALHLEHVSIAAAKVETLSVQADIISARAVAPVQNLLRMCATCAKVSTRWLLPRGRLVEADLAELRRGWTGLFHVEHSLTDSRSSILIAEGVQPQ